MQPYSAYGDPNNLTRQAMAPNIDLRSMLGVFRRRFRAFLAVALPVFALTAMNALTARSYYTSTATVEIQMRNKPVIDLGATYAGIPADAAAIDTEIEILLSQEVAGRVVKELRLDQDPDFNAALKPPGFVDQVLKGLKGGEHAPKKSATAIPYEETIGYKSAVGTLLSLVQVTRRGMTYMLDIRVTAYDGDKAAKIANSYANSYILQQVDARFEATKQANDLLDKRLGELRTEVRLAEDNVQRYKIDHGLLAAVGVSLTESEIVNLKSQLATARIELDARNARLETARKQLADGGSGEFLGEAIGSSVIAGYRAKAAEISSDLAEMATTKGANHPDRIRKTQEAEDIARQIKAEVARIVANLESEANVARTKYDSIAAQLSRSQGTLAADSRAGVELRNLESIALAARTNYNTMLARFQQTSEQEQISQADVRVQNKAQPEPPAGPNRKVNLIVGMILASIIGTIVIAALEFLDAGLRTQEDVESKLAMPYLGATPLITADQVGRSNWRRHFPKWFFYLFPFLASRNTLSSEAIAGHVIDRPLSAYAEAMRNLRAAALKPRADHRGSVLAITSSLPAEGKTTASMSMARTLSLSGMRVAIIDCDLRRRSLSAFAPLAPEAGIVEVVLGHAHLDQALQKDARSEVIILPVKQSPLLQQEIFTLPAMDDLLDTLRNRFDVIILDTAPVLPVADTRLLASKADSVLMLAAWRKTPHAATANALRILMAQGAHLVGVALTQVDIEAAMTYGANSPYQYYGSYRSYYTETDSAVT